MGYAYLKQIKRSTIITACVIYLVAFMYIANRATIGKLHVQQQQPIVALTSADNQFKVTLINNSEINATQNVTDSEKSVIVAKVEKDYSPKEERKDSSLDKLLSAIPFGDWQTVRSNSLYVYSAFDDSRINAVVITAVSVRKSVQVPKLCLFWYDGKKNATVVPASGRTIAEGSHDKIYGSCFFICKKGDLDSPDYVSLLYKPVNYTRLNLENAVKTLLPVMKVKDTGTPNSKLNYTVCVIPLYHNYSNVYEFVDFIETNKVLGAEHFIFYNYSTDRSMDPYFNYYMERGDISLYQWSIPEDFGGMQNLHYFGLVATVNDCLYRVMYKTKYAVFLDVDEIIVPMKGTSWDDIVKAQNGFLTMDGLFAGSYLIQNVFFKKEWPDDVRHGNDSPALKYRMNTLLKTKREEKIWPHYSRSKQIVVPELIAENGIHATHRFIPPYKSQKVHREVALVFHYRDWEDPDSKPGAVDDRMHVFANTTIPRVVAVHEGVAEMVKGHV